MELLQFPDKNIWAQRTKWIEDEIENSVTGSHLVSDHATALFMELQACYCVGAWLSVIILSISVIDAHLRETEAMDNNIGTAKLLEKFYQGDDDINWLRMLRNKYVHCNIESPALNIDMSYDDRIQLEKDACRAIKIVINAFFQSPGT